MVSKKRESTSGQEWRTSRSSRDHSLFHDSVWTLPLFGLWVMWKPRTLILYIIMLALFVPQDTFPEQCREGFLFQASGKNAWPHPKRLGLQSQLSKKKKSKTLGKLLSCFPGPGALASALLLMTVATEKRPESSEQAHCAWRASLFNQRGAGR